MQGVKGSGDPMAWQSYYQRNRERLLARAKAYRGSRFVISRPVERRSTWRLT
jgi:hypothetical protein